MTEREMEPTGVDRDSETGEEPGSEDAGGLGREYGGSGIPGSDYGRGGGSDYGDTGATATDLGGTDLGGTSGQPDQDTWRRTEREDEESGKL
jgi:hypothetical protein